MPLTDVLVVSHALDKIEGKLETQFFHEIDLVHEAVAHVIKSLRPTERSQKISHELRLEATRFQQRFNDTLEEYKNGREWQHYYDYILDLAYDIHWQMPDGDAVATLQHHGKALQKEIELLKGKTFAETRAQRLRRIRNLGKEFGLRSAGHMDSDRNPFNALCVDAFTHRPLEIFKVTINGVDNEATMPPRPPPEAVAKAINQSIGRDKSVPPPARDTPFPSEGFVTKEMLEKEKFKIYSWGTVYGFAPSADGTYSMVWAVQFSPIGSFDDTEQEAVDIFIKYMDKIGHFAHEVKNNRAQNGNKARKVERESTPALLKKFRRHGRLFGSGWRPGRKPGEIAGEYVPQSTRDVHDPEGYIDMHNDQEAVAVAWMIMGRRISPSAVFSNLDTLADTILPMFGFHDSDMATHGPSLGANMSVSMNDEEGRNFANSMHVDSDIDALPEFYGKIFTFGQWIHTNGDGNLVEGEELRKAIPDGYFILPGYRVGFDLGGGAVVSAIWRGALDYHGTTTSTVDTASGITRWGMSIQTNKKLPKRLRSGKGAIFGAFDRLRNYYEAMVSSDDKLD